MRKLGSWSLCALVMAIAMVAQADRIVISYDYNSLGICVEATAKLEEEGLVIGRASLEELVKGSHYRIRIKHYSRSGGIIYEGIAKYAIASGAKIEERAVKGEKRMEIFRSWP